MAANRMEFLSRLLKRWNYSYGLWFAKQCVKVNMQMWQNGKSIHLFSIRIKSRWLIGDIDVYVYCFIWSNQQKEMDSDLRSNQSALLVVFRLNTCRWMCLFGARKMSFEANSSSQFFWWSCNSYRHFCSIIRSPTFVCILPKRRPMQSRFPLPNGI